MSSIHHEGGAQGQAGRDGRLAADAGLAADLVREAGTLAAEMRARGLRTGYKTSVSDVVTAADHAAERLIADHLATMRPEDGVVGEEGAQSDSASGRTWYVDPVDGTYNFVRGTPHWCSAVALVEDGVPLLGAIYHPYEDALFLGGPGLGTTRNDEPLPPLEDRPLGEACVATYLHPPLYADPLGEVFARAVGGAATLRMSGSSSLDHAAVAAGRLDLVLAQSMKDWDWHPGAALVLGLGGVARRVRSGGREWTLSGGPRAVDAVIDALTGARHPGSGPRGG